MKRSFFLEGEQGAITIPVMAFLLEHPEGPVVFDTGLGRQFIVPDGHSMRDMVDMDEDAMIGPQLKRFGVDPGEVRLVVNSHLHVDHAGGNGDLAGATVVVQHSEWDYARETANEGRSRAYNVMDFDTGQELKLIEGALDLFDDGSIVLIPTPGHTPGHQSVRVRTQAGEVVLAGDACNLAASLDGMHLPDHAYDLKAYRRSLEWFATQRQAGMTIGFSHDPEQWAGDGTPIAWPPAATGRS